MPIGFTKSSSLFSFRVIDGNESPFINIYWGFAFYTFLDSYFTLCRSYSKLVGSYLAQAKAHIISTFFCGQDDHGTKPGF